MDLRETKAFSNTSVARHPWELARLEVIEKIFKKNSSRTEGTTIIDIGCGDTFFVEKFAEYFPSVNFIAVDTAFSNEIITEYSSRLLGKKIKLFSSLDEAKSSISSPVSAIFLFDVVEHIEEDYSFLRNLAAQEFISPQTKLFITVPAFQSLFTSHDVFLGHYRRYTNVSLKKLVSQTGFQEIESGYFFLSLVPARILQWLKEKVIGQPNKPTTDVAEWRGGSFITGFIKSILIFDYTITSLFKKAGINVPGLSNYIVCRKSV